MSEVKIYDRVSGISIEVGHTVRLINKGAIRSVEIINDRLCIDTGQATLGNLFIDFPDVTDPVCSDIGALRDAIQDMLRSRENKLFQQIQNVTAVLSEIKLALDGSHDYFREPLRIDEPMSGLIYKGYSNDFAANASAPVWAVSETKTSGTGTVTRWAGGTKDFLNVWNDRMHLPYLP